MDPEAKISPEPSLPVSVTRSGVAWTVVLSFFGASAFIFFIEPFESFISSAVFILATMALATLAVDVIVYKVHLRSSTGMNYMHSDFQIRRAFIKISGLWGTLGVIALLYAFLPIYDSAFYQQFLVLAWTTIIPFLVLSVPYMITVDMYQVDPYDGYWHAGNAITLNWKNVDAPLLWSHIRGWLVKAYFLPLMFGYFCYSVQDFLLYDYNSIENFVGMYAYLYMFIFFFDLSIATLGYATTFRPFDTHIRSTEPTVLGWLACLICYAPFWVFITGNYLDYETDWEWGNWLWNTTFAYGLWGSLILICLSIYVYAAAQFGCRFSNLTHRGIITSGPYRWTKHPAYVFKNISWWLIAIPFIPGDGEVATAIRNCFLLSCVSGIYFLRAKTEERHLSRDPDYVAYAQWIELHGMFRWIPRNSYFSWLKFNTS